MYGNASAFICNIHDNFYMHFHFLNLAHTKMLYLISKHVRFELIKHWMKCKKCNPQLWIYPGLKGYSVELCLIWIMIQSDI